MAVVACAPTVAHRSAASVEARMREYEMVGLLEMAGAGPLPGGADVGGTPTFPTREISRLLGVGAVVLALVLPAPLGAAALGDDWRDEGDLKALVAALRQAQPSLTRAQPRVRGLAEGLLAGLEAGRPIQRVVAETARPGRTADVLLTGYYEPILEARRTGDARFRHALYGLPAETGDRTRSRAEIDGGALTDRNLELFWLEDPVELFFLHVQGSGRLQLEDGTTVGVGYGGNNGRGYHSIGKELVRRGELTVEEATAPGIKAWLRAHPERREEILHTNPRYIFFREVPAGEASGPSGALGVPLVPYRSVAVDPAVTPLGSVGWLQAPLPDGTTFSQLVVAMDRGAAIRGPDRLDLFTGRGPKAETLAGMLRARGQVVWLELR